MVVGGGGVGEVLTMGIHIPVLLSEGRPHNLFHWIANFKEDERRLKKKKRTLHY